MSLGEKGNIAGGRAIVGMRFKADLVPIVEVFKFGLYMFFPVWIMFKFGDPAW